MHLTAGYCALAWCLSAHTCLIDSAINDALRIVTGRLRATPADNLPTLASIQPAELRRNGATVFSTPFHGARTSAPLSAHPSIECKRTAPQIETHICTHRTTSHQFIRQQQHTCGAVDGSGMECGVDKQHHKTPHFHSRHGHPGTALADAGPNGVPLSSAL